MVLLMRHKLKLKADLEALLRLYSLDSYTDVAAPNLAIILINQLEDIAKQNIHK
jgi:hypothetical protein